MPKRKSPTIKIRVNETYGSKLERLVKANKRERAFSYPKNSCFTPKRQKTEKGRIPFSHSPIGKIIIKLPAKVKQEFREKNLLLDRLREQKAQETYFKSLPKPHSCVNTIQSLMKTFDFIESLNSTSIFLKCKRYTPLLVYTSDKEDLSFKRYPKKHTAKRLTVPYRQLVSVLNIFEELVKQKVKIVQYNKKVVGEYIRGVDSFYTFLIALLDDTKKQLSEFEISFDFILSWNLQKNQFQPYKTSVELTDVDIVKVNFTVVVFISNKFGKISFKSNKKQQVYANTKIDHEFLTYLPKESRAISLNALFVLSVFLEYYIRESIRHFPRTLYNIKQDQQKLIQKCPASFLSINVSKPMTFKTNFVFAHDSKQQNIDNYIITKKTQQPSEATVLQTIKIEGSSKKSKSDSVKKDRNRTDNLEILKMKVNPEESLYKTSTEYFDPYNCVHSFKFIKSETLSRRVRCSDLKTLIEIENDESLVFLPKKSTSRVSIIESTRMKQTGVRLGYHKLSPLLFRLKPIETKIKPSTLKYLDLMCHQVLFFKKSVAVRFSTTPDSQSNIINKRFVSCWKEYLDFEKEPKNSSKTEEEIILNEIIDKVSQQESFPFTDYISARKINCLNDIKQWFTKNGNFVCLHFKLVVCSESKRFWLIPEQLVTEQVNSEINLSTFRSSDVKLGFLVRRTYGHDKTNTFVRKAFEDYVSASDFSDIDGSILFQRFYERSKAQWENNNFIRFDLFVSKTVWNSKVRKTKWLRNQLQVFTSCFESHVSVLFKKWACDSLLKQVMHITYTQLQSTSRNAEKLYSSKCSVFSSFRRISELKHTLQTTKHQNEKLVLDEALKLACFQGQKQQENIVKLEVSAVVQSMISTVEVSETEKIEEYFLNQWKYTKKECFSELSGLMNNLITAIERSVPQQHSTFYKLYETYKYCSHNGYLTHLGDKFLVNCFKRYKKDEINSVISNLRTGQGLDVVAPSVLNKTRDSFSVNTVAFDINQGRILTEAELCEGFINVCKSDKALRVIDWCFDGDFQIPEDYLPRESDIVICKGKKYFKVGVRTFLNVFSDEEFCQIEDKSDELYELSKNAKTYQKQLEQVSPGFVKATDSDKNSYFNDNTAHHVFNKKKCIRTKMFFNYRYLWTKDEMKHKDSKIANGIRSDPSRIPTWMTSLVQQKLMDKGIIKSRLEDPCPVRDSVANIVNQVESNMYLEQNDFRPIEMNVNSFALNIYHDGSIGLSQHFDDSKRFRANIVSMRLYSDSRLSFDCKGFGCTNGKFTVDMPRGSLQVLDNDSYAGRSVTHCIRPTDMMGKSGVLLLREIQPKAVKEADQFLIEQAIQKIQAVKL